MKIGKHTRGLVIAAATVLCALFALVPTAGAHVPSPTVTAQHAFIGDPLFGLGTTDGPDGSCGESRLLQSASPTRPAS